MGHNWFLMPLFLAACATPLPASHPIVGEWGGTHVGLSLTPNGGTLEYDCASGTLIGPLVPRPDGTFEAQGIHTPGWADQRSKDRCCRPIRCVTAEAFAATS